MSADAPESAVNLSQTTRQLSSRSAGRPAFPAGPEPAERDEGTPINPIIARPNYRPKPVSSLCFHCVSGTARARPLCNARSCSRRRELSIAVTFIKIRSVLVSQVRRKHKTSQRPRKDLAKTSLTGPCSWTRWTLGDGAALQVSQLRPKEHAVAAWKSVTGFNASSLERKEHGRDHCGSSTDAPRRPLCCARPRFADVVRVTPLIDLPCCPSTRVP